MKGTIIAISKIFGSRTTARGVIPNHKSYNWAPEHPHELGAAPAYVPVYGPGYGRWRLEIEMDKPAATDYMLNVLKPVTSAKETLPPVRKIEDRDTFGAEIVMTDGTTYTVRFGKDSLDAPRVNVSR